MRALLVLVALVASLLALGGVVSCGGDDGPDCITYDYYDDAMAEPTRSECLPPVDACAGVDLSDACDDDTCRTALNAECEAPYVAILCSTLRIGDQASVSIGCYPPSDP
jgi:hypothetical protein